MSQTEFTSVSIGDLLIFRKAVENPYRFKDNDDSELHDLERQAAFRHLEEHGVFPDEVKEIWHAPAVWPGARKVKQANWRNGGTVNVIFG